MPNTKRSPNSKMRISDLVLLNDHHVIALNKPATMPVQEDPSGDPSLHRLAQAYSKRDLYLVNRLDRPCSGVVLMAKSKGDAALLTAQWESRSVSKTYVAIVAPGISPSHGTLTNSIIKQGNRSVIMKTDPEPDSPLATLNYKIIAQLDNYDILEIEAHTGYFHQIRAQLAEAGFPIKGDVKYGARRGNRDRSICLHARSLSFVHPGSSESVVVSAPFPENDIWPACQTLLESNNT